MDGALQEAIKKGRALKSEHGSARRTEDSANLHVQQRRRLMTDPSLWLTARPPGLEAQYP